MTAILTENIGGSSQKELLHIFCVNGGAAIAGTAIWIIEILAGKW